MGGSRPLLRVRLGFLTVPRLGSGEGQSGSAPGGPRAEQSRGTCWTVSRSWCRSGPSWSLTRDGEGAWLRGCRWPPEGHRLGWASPFLPSTALWLWHLVEPGPSWSSDRWRMCCPSHAPASLEVGLACEQGLWLRRPPWDLPRQASVAKRPLPLATSACPQLPPRPRRGACLPDRSKGTSLPRGQGSGARGQAHTRAELGALPAGLPSGSLGARGRRSWHDFKAGSPCVLVPTVCALGRVQGQANP